MSATEYDYRAQLAAISEPGDTITGTLVRDIGAEATIRLAQEDTPKPPESINPEEFAAWADRLRARVRTSTVDGIRVACQQRGITLTIPGDSDWPTGLDDLGVAAPLILFQKGDPGLLAQTITDKIAVVGARAATGYGEHVTMETTAGLVDRGYTIVSGAAYGIDGMAHRAALAAGGNTVAILAGGVDRYYPSGHDALLQRIAEKGAVVSELPPGHPPTKWRFLQRNRIIAATTAVTVVVEAGWRSGSLNTAGHAIALGRTVAAFPGPVTSAASAGAHRLIRDMAAKLVTGADDISQLLNVGDERGIPAIGPQQGRTVETPDRRAELHDFSADTRTPKLGARTPGLEH
ncbi:MAG: DNA-processing protein DprA [Salinibacterium sp.]|nr:DNA-processing protein DprA [Salinibacterium sp.]